MRLPAGRIHPPAASEASRDALAAPPTADAPGRPCPRRGLQALQGRPAWKAGSPRDVPAPTPLSRARVAPDGRFEPDAPLAALPSPDPRRSVTEGIEPGGEAAGESGRGEARGAHLGREGWRIVPETRTGATAVAAKACWKRGLADPAAATAQAVRAGRGLGGPGRARAPDLHGRQPPLVVALARLGRREEAAEAPLAPFAVAPGPTVSEAAAQLAPRDALARDLSLDGLRMAGLPERGPE